MTKVKLIQSKYEKIVPVYNKVTRGGNKTGKVYIPGKGVISYHEELITSLQPLVAELLDEIGLTEDSLARSYYNLTRYSEKLNDIWTINYEHVEKVLEAGIITGELEYVNNPEKNPAAAVYVKRTMK